MAVAALPRPGQPRHAVGADVMRTSLRGRTRPGGEYAAQSRAEHVVMGILVLLLLLLEGRYEFDDGWQGAAAAARLRRDIEAFHQAPLLLAILLTARTYRQLFKATV